MSCAGGFYLLCAIRKRPTYSRVPARVRRSVLRRGVCPQHTARIGQTSVNSRTAHTLVHMHRNVESTLRGVGGIRATFLHKRPRPAPRSCDVHASGKRPHLTPPHQLYRSVHSCHLDRFLSQLLYHPCRGLLSRYHQGGDRVLKAPQSKLNRELLEKCGELQIRHVNSQK